MAQMAATPRTPTGPGGGITLMELIDLALCTPEVGAVNFNILRILLRDIVEKTGIDKKPAKVNDVEAGQVENYRNYVQGSGAVTPGPGVLKIGPGGRGAPPPPPQNQQQGPGLQQLPPQGPPQQQQQQRQSQDQGQQGQSQPQSPNQSQAQPGPQQNQQQSQNQPQQQQTPRTPNTGRTSQGQTQQVYQVQQQQPPLNNPSNGNSEQLLERITRLEKTIDGLYSLPTNAEIIERAKTGAGPSMSVNDMWQIIQLNNRIAAAEAAIQKMASLIEDLAKGMGKVKGETKVIKEDTADLQLRKSDLQVKGQELSDKFEKVGDVVLKLQKDMDNFKRFWKRDRDHIEKALGVPLAQVPSFMKDRPQQQQQQQQHKGGDGSSPRSDGEGKKVGSVPSEQFQRGTQTLPHPKEKSTPPPPPPPQKTSPESSHQEKAPQKQQQQEQQQLKLQQQKPPQQQQQPQRVSEAKPQQQQSQQASVGTGTGAPPAEKGKSAAVEQQQQIQKPQQEAQLTSPRRPAGKEERITPEKIVQMSPEEIAKITPEEARQIPPEQYKTMSPDQRKALHDIKKASTMIHHHTREKSRPALGLEAMKAKEIQAIPLDKIETMPYHEAVNLPDQVLEGLTVMQREKLKAVIEKGPPPKRLPSTKFQQPLKTTDQQQQQQTTPQLKKSYHHQHPAQAPKKSMGVAALVKTEIQEITAAEIEKEMPYEEAKTLGQKVLNKMTPEQQQAVKKVVEAGPQSPQQAQLLQLSPPPSAPSADQSGGPKRSQQSTGRFQQKQQQQQQQKQQQQQRPSSLPRKSEMGVATMKQDQIKKLNAEKIVHDMPYEEAKAIPEKVLEKMTPEQKEAVKKVVLAGPDHEVIPDSQVYHDHDDYDDDSYEEFHHEDQPSSASAAPPPLKEKRSLTNSKIKSRRGTTGDPLTRPLTIEEIEDIATLPAEEIGSIITHDQAVAIPDSEMKKRFTEQQIKEIEKIRKSDGAALKQQYHEGHTYPDDTPEEEYYTEEEEEYGKDEGVGTGGGGARRKSFKDRPRAVPQRPQREKGKHHRHHTPRGENLEEGQASKKQTEVDFTIKEATPATGGPLPPMSLEEYLASLPPEEAANMAADAVQRELQKQYQHLQGMQRQLATDIQNKMEFIYQKLLKEIAAQNMTSSPFSVGGTDECPGIGICTGLGIPAGITVTQYSDGKDRKSIFVKGIPEGKICPGPGVCPGSDICPYCRADAKAHEALRSLKDAERRPLGSAGTGAAGTVEYDETFLHEVRSMVMLDLEKLRNEMKSRHMGPYDEQEIMERLTAVWEALKILKGNEESLAVKIAKQDTLLRKIPGKTFDRFQQIPDDSWEVLATGNFGKFMMPLSDESTRKSTETGTKEDETLKPATGRGKAGSMAAGLEDIQTLFNNLATVIAECTEHKDRINHLADTTRVMESGMVTKQMLTDALSDKADRGLINTKVSYDEFGSTIDELHHQLQNLMMEGFQRNENWKKVTSDLSESLSEKLDKVEIAPIRVFFKTHLKALEEKVQSLSDVVEEPDSAGTRKKLLRDLNCLSCDRMVKISGVTSGSTLPILGPMPAGHPTASKRALNLHRMRMMKKLDPTGRMSAREQQLKLNTARNSGKGTTANAAEIANDMDIMHVINRYSGGSHTTVNTADVLAAAGRRPSTSGPTISSERRSSANTAETGDGSATLRPPPPTAAAVESPPPVVLPSPSVEYFMEEEE